jgi:hypothetical protein
VQQDYTPKSITNLLKLFESSSLWKSFEEQVKIIEFAENTRAIEKESHNARMKEHR